jgi:hypothetical protein
MEFHSHVLYESIQNNVTRNDSGFDSYCGAGKDNVIVTYSLAHLCDSFVQYSKKSFKITTSAPFLVVYFFSLFACVALLQSYLYWSLICHIQYVHSRYRVISDAVLQKVSVVCPHNMENL